MANSEAIVGTVPMKLTLTAVYEAPIWSDDSDDLDVIAREEKAEMEIAVEEFLISSLGPHKNVRFTIEPVFEAKE